MEKLREGLEDILERNHQSLDNGCPWCEAEEYPVDEKGEAVEMACDATEWHCDHYENCAVTMIEELLAGKYEFLNSLPEPNTEISV